MLIGVFKSNQKLVNGLIILLTILLWFPSFFIEKSESSTHFFSTGFIWLDSCCAIVLISAQAIYLNVIVNEYKLVDNNSYLTSLMLVVFNSCLIQFFDLNQIIIANTFLMLGLHQLLRVYDVKGGYGLSFNAGFLISIATVFYLPSAIFLLFLWFGLIYLITLKWRDFVISLIGFSVPILYVVCYNFVVADLLDFNVNHYVSAVFNVSWSAFSVIGKVLFSLILAIVLLSFIRVASGLNSGPLRKRKMMVVILLMLLFGIGTLMLNKFDYLATFIVITIPLSIIVANFFQNIKKKWLAELLFALVFVVMIVNYFS